MFMKNGTYLALKNRNETQFFFTFSVDGSVSQYEERLQNKASSQKKTTILPVGCEKPLTALIFNDVNVNKQLSVKLEPAKRSRKNILKDPRSSSLLFAFLMKQALNDEILNSYYFWKALKV